MIGLSLCRLIFLAAIPLALAAQGLAVPGTNVRPATRGKNSTGTEDKRILGIFTNHRTAEESAANQPLTRRGKLAIAWADTTDRAIFLQAAFISGIGQATNGNPSFGQGMQGYSKRFAAAYADFAIQNFMTEGVFPALLHQDPRYFRRRDGSMPSRLAYATSRLFITRTDSGKRQFNYSEVVGGATALAISNAYYPDSRTVKDNLGRYVVQLGFDAASNVLKEFWPDLKRRLPRRFTARQLP